VCVAVLVLSAVRPPTTLPVHALAGPSSFFLQPGPGNGTDTFLSNLRPVWNFGDNASLWAGPNATTGGVDRSLVSFTLPGLPPNSIVLNATLGLYATQGSGGLVQARALTSA
jgi:hypothetical protein